MRLFNILIFLHLLINAGIVTGQPVNDKKLLQNQISVEQLKEALLMNREWVKYPVYTDRAAWDALTGTLKQEIIEKGEKYLSYEWKVIPATAYLEYEKSGSRDIMQKPYGANNSALSSLLLAELAEGEGRFIGQIINGVWHSCDMSSWVLSAHLHSLQKSRRALADPDEQIIDLTSGDLGSLLTWTWYLLKDEMNKVNPVIARRLRGELQQRILDPYRERSDFWWQAFSLKPGGMVNNWNPWCNFNVLACYMLLEDDRDKLAHAVYRTMVSVDQFINYTNTDGACEEGPSYWGHAAGKLYDYLQLLYYATGGKVSVFDHPQIRNMGEYIAYSYIGDGWVVNFADASAKGGGDAGLIFRYGKAVKSEDMKGFAAYLFGQREGKGYPDTGLDIFRQMESLACYDELSQATPGIPRNAQKWYPGTEFCYMQNDNGFFFAAKGGYNNESHNHNDVGSFILYIDHHPVFIDIGVGTYTRQTFSNERYSIWTMQSGYHSIPEINGLTQSHGAQFRSKDAAFSAGKSIFSLNIAGGYPQEAEVQSWTRTYTLEQKGGLIIKDKFRLQKSKGPNSINFMTWAAPDISTPGTVIIDAKGKKIKMTYDNTLFEPSVKLIEQTDQRLSGVWGNTVFKLALKEKKPTTTGSYTFSIHNGPD